MKPLLKVIQLHKNQNQLIKQARQNNREAQQTLYSSHAPKMLSVCRYYIKDVHHAEEVMLNGFYKVFTQLHTFQDKGSFEGWIRRIMVRESISFLRQKKQIVFAEVEQETGDVSPLSSDDNFAVEDIQMLIDSLPEGYKMVFVMYAIEGYKHHEIAELLNISEGTSKSQLYKARQLLQQQVNALNSDSYGIK
ncbi:RNA polymerase ECF-type sigma factor [Formosa agariphila KMM 3901]|uniref:RNA polymerase ECF-type sigma factor n=1 Tax=Formosa agariphila (strain DSM 15362 / KCTC 12365 / LMG 23005 / KMM 3901 / M-2Alg 35-1) TaxID=1347342 RepID=T2KI45_FORAG|nr:RNA polymerase sigma factor [Formosa agariphila]CDF78093.1 RNA polymerase ECF-type sigma factor [Formosa agariphila KMM 3901]